MKTISIEWSPINHPKLLENLNPAKSLITISHLAARVFSARLLSGSIAS